MIGVCSTLVWLFSRHSGTVIYPGEAECCLLSILGTTGLCWAGYGRGLLTACQPTAPTTAHCPLWSTASLSDQWTWYREHPPGHIHTVSYRLPSSTRQLTACDVTTDIDIRKIKDPTQENISSDMMTLDGGKVNIFLRDEKSWASWV